MEFNRIKLLITLKEASENSENEIYKELLSVWYRLLEQESINNTFINTFYYYNKLSEKTIMFL